MDRRYIIPLVILAAVVIAFLLQKPGVNVRVVGDRNVVYLIPLEKNIILRGHYPFTHPQEVLAIINYPTIVFNAKGHRVILQLIENNACVTNFGEVNRSERVDVNTCLTMNGFVIDFAEGENIIVLEDNQIIVRGTPQDLPTVMRYLTTLIYPDAPEIYAKAVEIIKGRGA